MYTYMGPDISTFKESQPLKISRYWSRGNGTAVLGSGRQSTLGRFAISSLHVGIREYRSQIDGLFVSCFKVVCHWGSYTCSSSILCLVKGAQVGLLVYTLGWLFLEGISIGERCALSLRLSHTFPHIYILLVFGKQREVLQCSSHCFNPCVRSLSGRVMQLLA